MIDTHQAGLEKEIEQIEFYINYIGDNGIFKKTETLEIISEITDCNIEYLETQNTPENVTEISNLLYEKMELKGAELKGIQEGRTQQLAEVMKIIDETLQKPMSDSCFDKISDLRMEIQKLQEKK